MRQALGGRSGSLIAALACLLVTVACVAPATPAAGPGIDNAAARRAFDGHVENVEVTIAGVVDRILSEQTGPSGPHQRFIVRLEDVGLTVLIEHNLTIAPSVPVAEKQPVTVRGEYIWNAQGGLVHFTHHDPSGSHPGGYILFAGKRYE